MDSKSFARENYIVLLILVLGLYLGLHGFNEPYTDLHSWRQTQTAMIARNFYENGFRHFYPEVDWNGNDGGIMEIEFQLVPMITAVLYYAFGVQPWVGRAVVILFSLAGIIYLYRLVKLHIGKDAALYSAFFFSISPLNVFFGRAFIPESAMIFFSLATLYHFSLWMREGKKKDMQLATASAALAFLVKIPTLYLLIPLAFIAFSEKGFGIFADRRLYVFLLVSLVIPILYYWHIHEAADLKEGTWSVGSDKWGNVNIWKDPNFYGTIYQRLTTVILTPLGFYLFMFGVILGARERRALMFYFWLISVVLYIFVVARGNMVHNYYQMPVVPVASVFIGLLLAKLERLKDLEFAPYVLCLAMLYLAVNVNLPPLYRQYASPMKAAGDFMQGLGDGDSLIIAVQSMQGTMPETLYFSHRKGWVLRPETATPSRIDYYVEKGAKYLVISPRYAKSGELEDYLKGRKSYVQPDFEVYELQ